MLLRLTLEFATTIIKENTRKGLLQLSEIASSVKNLDTNAVLKYNSKIQPLAGVVAANLKEVTKNQDNRSCKSPCPKNCQILLFQMILAG